MNIKKKLKGFTLIELIIVMAIFGIIMVGTMSIINPLNKIVKSASLQEANAAAVDNVKRYMEGSLRYADCIEVFQGDLCEITSNGTQKVLNGTDAMDKAVQNFVTNHYNNRVTPGSEDPLEGKVRVLKIDNGDGGKISEYEYSFTAGYKYYKVKDGDHVTKEVIENGVKKEVDDLGAVSCEVKQISSEANVINDAYYKDYSFYFIPGYNKQVTEKDETVIEAAADNSGNLVFDTDDDNADIYYATVKPYDETESSPFTFKPNMFSMNVMTYKNSDSVGNTKVDPTKPVDYSGLVFRSPFALSNVNISLVNINSAFSKSKASNEYGPIRWEGTDSKGKSYKTTDMVDLTDPKDGMWDYEKITTDECKFINSRYYGYDPMLGDCIYFIYTLPDMK